MIIKPTTKPTPNPPPNPSIHPGILPSIQLAIHLSTHPSIQASSHPSNWPSIHPQASSHPSNWPSNWQITTSICSEPVFFQCDFHDSLYHICTTSASICTTTAPALHQSRTHNWELCMGNHNVTATFSACLFSALNGNSQLGALHGKAQWLTLHGKSQRYCNVFCSPFLCIDVTNLHGCRPQQAELCRASAGVLSKSAGL